MQGKLLSQSLLWATEEPAGMLLQTGPQEEEAKASSLCWSNSRRSRCQDRIRCLRLSQGKGLWERKGLGEPGDHSVGLTPRAGQRTIGKRGQWKSLGWQCSSRGAQQGRWGVFEPTVSSEETCVSRDWACSRVPAQLNAGCERSLGSLVSTQKWWQISRRRRLNLRWICLPLMGMAEAHFHSCHMWPSGSETGAQRKAVGLLGGLHHHEGDTDGLRGVQEMGKELSSPPSWLPLTGPLDRNILPITPVYPCEGLANKNMAFLGQGIRRWALPWWNGSHIFFVGEVVFPQIHIYLETQHLALFGNRVSADVISEGFWRWDHPGFGVGPKSSVWCPLCRREDRERYTRKKAMRRWRQKLAWILPQAQEHEEASEKAKKGSP